MTTRQLYPGERILVSGDPKDFILLHGNETCPHSHLSIEFLKQLGKAADAVGQGIAETAIIAALKGVGGAFE